MQTTRVRFSQFWWYMTLTLVSGILIAHGLGIQWLRVLPPKPRFSIFDRNYVGSYTRGSADHYLFRFGLFGMGEKIRRGDILLLGTSHTELGLSAAQLGSSLITSYGRPLRVFNLGLERGEGISFFRDILELNNTRDKILIADLYNGFGTKVSDYAQQARQADVLGAYIEVIQIWTDFVRDWILDGLLPHLTMVNDPAAPHISMTRFLNHTVIRSWKTGDLLEIWTPLDGAIYHGISAKFSCPFVLAQPERPSQDYSVAFQGAFPSQFLSKHNIHPVFTLLPFPKYDPRWASVQASSLGYPFIAIDPIGLRMLNGDHLNAEGRTLASMHLAQGLLAISNLTSAVKYSESYSDNPSP